MMIKHCVWGLAKLVQVVLLAGIGVCLVQAEPVADKSNDTLRSMIERVSSTREYALMKSICDDHAIGFGSAIFCERCPSYTGKSGKKTPFKLATVVTGTFTKPNTAEKLVYMSGCEETQSDSGGLVLLRNEKSGWRRVWYQPGKAIADCMLFRTTKNVHSLLCRRDEKSKLGVEHGDIVWVSIDVKGLAFQSIMLWQDNIKSNPRKLISAFPSKMFRSDFNQDGRGDVRISYQLLEQTIPVKYSGALQALAQGYPLKDPEKISIIFLFDGLSLQPHPNDEQIYKKLQQQLAGFDKVN